MASWQAGKLMVKDLVHALPPEPLGTFLADAGYLPRGVPLLKHIRALPDQTVCRFGYKIRVASRWGRRSNAITGAARFPIGRAVVFLQMIKCSW
jgi:type IV secretory pathway protease TraF